MGKHKHGLVHKVTKYIMRIFLLRVSIAVEQRDVAVLGFPLKRVEMYGKKLIARNVNIIRNTISDVAVFVE